MVKCLKIENCRIMVFDEIELFFKLSEEINWVVFVFIEKIIFLEGSDNECFFVCYV